MPDKSSVILMVEDSDDDFEIALAAFRESRLENPIFRCVDGDDALDFLHHRGKYANDANAPAPALVLLDLNLPGTDGHEVLEELKSTATMKHIPVVILTTSSDRTDIERCYKAGADSYLQKPVDVDGLFGAIKLLKNSRFEIVIVPQNESSS